MRTGLHLAQLGLEADFFSLQTTATRPTAQPVVEDGHSGLEEIIVTAQKRAENLQVVPIAVSALTGETIERLQAVSLQGLQGTVPSIQIGSFANTPNTAVFSIRGIGVIDPDPYGFEPTPDNPGRFYADINNPLIPVGGSPYDTLLLTSRLGDALKELWASQNIWFLYEQVLLKEGGAARRTPWHQDSSYLPIKGEMLAVVWITLEQTPAENALEFVKSSHRGTLYDGSAFDPADDTAPIYGDGSLPRLPDIEADRSQWPILSWDIQPGDVLVFHPATLHGGAPTRSGSRRRTLSLRFFGDDAVYQPLPTNGVRGIGIEGQTIWDKLASCLKLGDPLRHPDFMQVRGHAAQ